MMKKGILLLASFLLFGVASKAGANGWIEVETFENLQTDLPIAEQGEWRGNGTSSGLSVVRDPYQEDNTVLHLAGEPLDPAPFIWASLPQTVSGQATLFFRQMISPIKENPSRRQVWYIGLNSPETAGDSSRTQFDVHQMIDWSSHRAGNSREYQTAFLPFAWINYWLVVDTETDTLEVYRSQGRDFPEEEDRLTRGLFNNSVSELAYLKIARNASGSDWQSYFDDFYLSNGINLTLPEKVLSAYPENPKTGLVRKEWLWEYNDSEHPIALICDLDATKSEEIPTVIYLLNMARPRIGTDSDEAIIRDLVSEGLAVVVIDCRDLPSESMAFERSLLRFHNELLYLVGKASKGKIILDFDHLFWLPEGYRLARDLVFWNIEKHGSHGSLERILHTHNTVVVERFNAEPIERVEDLVGANNVPLDYDLRMDVMYPSGDPEIRVPVIAQFATLDRRPRSFRNGERPMEPIGWLTSGYALALIDHAYNPLARTEHFRHFQPGYTLQDHNDIKMASAAIRFLRAHADDYNLGYRMGALGHSKSSYSTVRLADPRHPKQPEHSRYSGFPEGTPEAQPWQGFSSEIHVGFASMGNGTRRIQYFNKHMVPFVIAVGKTDRFGHWDVFPPLVAACEENDVNHIALWMEDLGHDRPFGMDKMSGRERHLLIRHVFDQNLYPFGKTDLEVLFTLPHDGARNVALDGMTRFLTEDENLPEDMHGLSPYRPITVRFARSIQKDLPAENYLSLLEAETGEQVRGQWSSSLRNSRFEFITETPLNPNSLYQIIVHPSIPDADGLTMNEGVIHSFRTMRK